MAQLNFKNTDSPLTPQSGRVGLFIKTSNSPTLITSDGTEIPLAGTPLEQTILDALNAAQSPTAQNPFVTLSELQSFLGNVTTRVYGGNVQWSGTGFVFDISATGYFIDGVFYELPAGQVTLAASDPTDPRIDTFYVDDTEFNKLTGTPGTTPVKPSVNPLTQIELSFVTVPAGSTEPVITNEDVYLENTEWVTSSAGTGTFDPDSTVQSFAGTKSFEVTDIENGGTFIFTRGSDIDLTPYDNIGSQVFLKANMNNGRNLGIQFFDNSDNPVSNEVNMPLSKQDSILWQFSGINLSDFTFTDKTIVRKVKIRYSGSGGPSSYTGLYLDNIIIQNGVDTPVVFDGVESVTGFSVDNTDTKNPIILYPAAVKRENNTVLFDKDYIIGNAAARTGNILFDFTGAQLGASTRMRHNDAGAFTFPTEAQLMFPSGDISTSADNFYMFTLVDNTLGSEVVEVLHAMVGGVS